MGRIAGVPLRFHWSAPLLIIVLAVGLGGGTLPEWAPNHSQGAYRAWAVAGALLLGASLIAHEGAHALVARRVGIKVKDVTVFALGGVTRMGQATTARDEGVIAAAGPLTSLVCGGVGLGAAVLTHDVAHWALVSAVLAWAGWANIALAAFNLVPAAPLDGGRVLQAVIWRARGDRERAARIAARCGQVAGALLVGAGLVEFFAGATAGLWLVLLGWFLSMAAVAEVRRSTLTESLRGLHASDAMRPHPRCRRLPGPLRPRLPRRPAHRPAGPLGNGGRRPDPRPGGRPAAARNDHDPGSGGAGPAPRLRPAPADGPGPPLVTSLLMPPG
ncbi:M50 family metallopeptidase [Actinacidiphila guanduensis]|nr:M50 family metallopeptidase [Actinacidiphila guanduensis]